MQPSKDMCVFRVPYLGLMSVQAVFGYQHFETFLKHVVKTMRRGLTAALHVACRRYGSWWTTTGACRSWQGALMCPLEWARPLCLAANSLKAAPQTCGSCTREGTLPVLCIACNRLQLMRFRSTVWLS